jgi:hypothetical protein
MTNAMMHELLTTVADSYDDIRPGSGDGDAVRKVAAEKYPLTHAEQLQHIANLCPRHASELLPQPTEDVCADCKAERASKT